MSRRADLLEFAVLGLLHESPMHGYELRKRLNAALGMFRALSYGTLYPCLRSLSDRGLIIASGTDARPGTTGGRARIVYELTADGKEHFAELTSRADASAYEDDGFELRMVFFARTEAEVRMRILEGRRSRLVERLERIRAANLTHRPRMDQWTSALQDHGEESTRAEVGWLTGLINAERQMPTPRPGSLADPHHPAFIPPSTTRGLPADRTQPPKE
ncbi:MAG: PadR family transcriptional regulator [Nostocoides sp.]